MANLVFRAMVATVTVVVSLSAVSAEQERVEKLFRDDFSVDVKALYHNAYDGVFDEQLYQVEYTVFASNDRFSPGSDYRVFESNGALVPVLSPGTDERLGYFDDLIDADFRLNAQTAPRLFSALKALLPDQNFTVATDKAIRKQDGKWQFLVDSFFDNMKGFVVSVEGDGRIRSVAYNMKLPPLDG